MVDTRLPTSGQRTPNAKSGPRREPRSLGGECRLIDCDKQATLVRDVDAGRSARVGPGRCGTSLCLPLSFAGTLKLL